MSFVSYSDVIEGLHERFLTIDGFPAYNEDGVLINLLAYEPAVVQHTPMIYSLLVGFERVKSGQLTEMRYRILHRLLIQWQDNEEAELELMPLVQRVPASVDLDPTLGGRVTLGSGAFVGRGESGFTTISTTKYRCLDFISTVSTKAPFQSGI